MEINIKNEYRVEVGLTDEELSRLGVSFETLDYANIETRRALWTVVGELRRQGVDVSLSGKVLIEADKTDAGCRIAITALPPKGSSEASVKQFVKTPRLPAVFTSESEAALRRAFAGLGARAETAVFRHGDRWFLLVRDGCTDRALLEAEEFCPCLHAADNVLIAFLEEHAGKAAL